MSTITHRATWSVDSQETRMAKGKLIRVRKPNGSIVKMYEEDARRQGLIPGAKAAPKPDDKKAPAPGDKMAPMPGDKSAPQAAPPSAAPDDFTTIPGVGPAAARLIVANGITTFAQLDAATSLDFLSK